jgi:hypothetical protein
MIGYALQDRHVPIYCCPKPAGWLREANASRAQHALFRIDSTTRQKTFSEMVYGLGFDPTAGMLMKIKQHTKRILILGETCPPLPDSTVIDQSARQSCNADSSAHVLAGTPASSEYKVQQYVEAPYFIHPVTYPEPGGRLDNMNVVHAWRQWRIRRQKQLNWRERYQTIVSMLEPTQVFWTGHAKPTWTSEISENALPLFLN